MMLNRKQDSSDPQQLVPKYVRGKNPDTHTREKRQSLFVPSPDLESAWAWNDSNHPPPTSALGQAQDGQRTAWPTGTWFRYLPLPFKFIWAKTSKQACPHKYPLNGSWFCLFHLAQVTCDLTFIFPYASFWSVWVFYFIFSTPKWFFSFCHSESSYIHSTEREFSNLECNIQKSFLEGCYSSVTVTLFHIQIKVTFTYQLKY